MIPQRGHDHDGIKSHLSSAAAADRRCAVLATRACDASPSLHGAHHPASPLGSGSATAARHVSIGSDLRVMTRPQSAPNS